VSESAAKELLRGCNGFYVGMLNDVEIEAFNALVKIGKARRVYSGGAALLGLAKVEIYP
jgi:hypothetical protein